MNRFVTEEKSISCEAFNANNSLFIDHKCFGNSLSSDIYEEKCEKSLLHLAIEGGNVEILKLLQSNPNFNINVKSISKINESS